MSIYLGYYRPTSGFITETGIQQRTTGSVDNSRFLDLVRALPDRLPATCRIVGAYAARGNGAVLSDPGPPSVIIVDTSDDADLTFITTYYAGYLEFNWVPANSVGATRQERDANPALQSQAVPAGVR